MTQSLARRILSFPVAGLLAAAWSLSAPPASARSQFIRDAEIEATIAAYAQPLFEAAGLDPQAVRVYLLQDDSLNAFVAGGMNLFIHTGLLMKAESANQIIGVIAHETGHIAGGHLARSQDALRNASIEAILACIAGIGAAVVGATQSGGDGASAGAGLCAIGQQVGLRSLLQFSRTQESAADQAGMSYLDATRQSARGTVEFLQILTKQEALLGVSQQPYLRSHPLTRDRIDAVKDHIEHSPYSSAVDSIDFQIRFARMRAKLIGYLQPLPRVLRAYPESDQSMPGRYARAFGYYRAGKLPQATALVDGLLAEFPDDPYFLELKGEMLFKNGRARDALPYYQAAALAVPGSALLRLELGQVQLEIGEPGLTKAAITELEAAVRIEPRYSMAWRQLSIAYGRDGQLPMAALALAETASASGKAKEARRQADRAMQGLPEGSPAWLRAQDIYNEATAESD
ncbi:MAG: M48 family metalloprotease [Dongiaceae bacterium]